jgi:trigger factor
MSVVLAIEEVGPCRKQLRIEVPAPAVEAETERVTAEFGKRARIPGFRKGKVPPSMVRKRFGPEIEQEVLERLVPRYWRQAAAEKSIEALTNPSVGEVEHKAGESLVFTAVVEVRPEIELRNYQDFALPEVSVEPTREDVERTIGDLRRSHADWKPVERSAAAGDTVRAEVVETTEGASPETQNAEFEIGASGVWAEVSAAATGLAAGQGARFTRREGEGDEARERSFDLRVLEVKEAVLPELDAEFAKHFGNFDSMAAFESNVVERLRAAKRDEARQIRERALLDQLTERHPMALPEGVVHHEVEDLMREYAGFGPACCSTPSPRPRRSRSGRPSSSRRWPSWPGSRAYPTRPCASAWTRPASWRGCGLGCDGKRR